MRDHRPTRRRARAARRSSPRVTCLVCCAVAGRGCCIRLSVRLSRSLSQIGVRHAERRWLYMCPQTRSISTFGLVELYSCMTSVSRVFYYSYSIAHAENEMEIHVTSIQ